MSSRAAAVLLAGCVLAIAATPAATAKKDHGRTDAAAGAPATGPVAGKHSGKGNRKGAAGGLGNGAGPGAGKGGGHSGAKGSAGLAAQSKGNGGAGHKAKAGRAGRSSATPAPTPTAVPAAVAPPAPPVIAPASPTASAPAGAAPSTPGRSAPTRRTARPGTAARGGPAIAGASTFGAAALFGAAAGTGPAAAPAGAAGTGSSAGRPADVRRASRTSREESAVARTVERIVSVIPWEMWALIGLLAAVMLALGARSWIGVRQRRRLLEDVGLLQSALLPAVPATVGALATSAAYRPTEGPGAGGDFYDMFALTDGRLGVVVGDLSGHGREVLPQTALVRYTLRAYLETGVAPRAALQMAESVLDHQLEVAFATVALAVYDPRDRTLTHAGAGHPPPIVLGSEPVVPVTAAASPPIGAGLKAGIRQTVVSLPGRATACFYTDGLLEARAGGELFGAERLERAVAELGSAITAEALLAKVAEACDGRPDDMAACVLGVPGGDSAPRVREEELEVDRRELSSDRPEEFLLACGVAPALVPGLLHAARDAAERLGAAVIHVRMGDGPPGVEVGLPDVEVLHAPTPAPGSATLQP